MAMNLSSSSGKRRRGRGGRAPIAEINVTPFVDVMLVLLIIFMVTAPLLVAGVPLDLPDSRAKALDQDQEPLQISIDNNGYVYIGDDQLAFDALPSTLAARCSNSSGDKPQQVMLRADRALEYGQVMLVMGELSRAGCSRVSLVTTGSSDTL